MSKRISRRQLLKALAAATGVASLYKVLGIPFLQGTAQELDEHAYLPIIRHAGTATPTATPTATSTPTSTPTSPPTGSRVVHVHSDDATSWDFSTGWYGDYVNQSAVNRMMKKGLEGLTGKSIEVAWQDLLRDYSHGQAIAIKVNFNNAWSPEKINALIEPVNALVGSMVEDGGVLEEDVWVFDVRALPLNRFCTRCLYPNVRFFGTGSGTEQATFTSSDPNAEVQFAHPSLTARRITDVVINATYLIDMPIIKDHGLSPVTLSFKNHFGSIDEIIRAGDDSLHNYISSRISGYSSSYSPKVDIYLNPHIRDKTVLVVGDGLFGGFGAVAEPSRWSTFGNDAPNSLFFATDPVAIDCVMFDILDAEPVSHPGRDEFANDYLTLAAGAGLGIFERGDPWGGGYDQIEYLKIEA